MTAIWYTSDLHVGHARVAELRGFATVEEHDLRIAEEWSTRVGKKDHVWVLGDLALSDVDRALRMIRKLPGTKHFVTGNHDPCFPMHRNAHKQQKRFLESFDSVQAFARRRIHGREVLLSHFPYDTDHTEEIRYSQYRLRDEGRWLMHGHTHGKERRHGYQIHVGLDAWNLRPVHESEIVEMIEDGEHEKEEGRRYMEEGPGRPFTVEEIEELARFKQRRPFPRKVVTLPPL